MTTLQDRGGRCKSYWTDFVNETMNRFALVDSHALANLRERCAPNLAPTKTANSAVPPKPTRRVLAYNRFP